MTAWTTCPNCAQPLASTINEAQTLMTVVCEDCGLTVQSGIEEPPDAR